MARADTASSLPTTGSAWLDAMEAGTRTWLAALTSLVRIGASVAEAQAAMGAQMASFWMRGLPEATLPTPKLLRDELVLTGLQAERVADAAHNTLKGLDRPLGAAIPIPLPD